MNFDTTMFAIFYVIPTIVCLVHETREAVRRLHEDREQREKFERGEAINFYPGLTYGSLLSALLASFIPIINFMYATFEIIPRVVKPIFSWAFQLLDIPVVPRRNKQ